MAYFIFSAPRHSSGNDCPKNEEQVGCWNACTERTCENFNPPVDRVCNRACQVGVCDCIEGYRRLNGTCVPEWECPQWCPGLNEAVSDCYNECVNDRACPGVRGNTTQICSLACQLGKCDCKNGYMRNKCGICVLAAQCADSNLSCSCPENESIQCVNSCTAKTCNDVTSGANTDCASYCSYTCDCVKDFYRLYSDCVPRQECCF